MTDRSVTVTAVEPISEGLRVTCRLGFDHFSARYPAPFAPCLLMTDETGDVVCELHRLVEVNGDIVVCDRFTELDPRVPEVGGCYHYQGWWVPGAMDAVLDESALWHRRVYPDNGDHDHCLLTYDTLAAYGDYAHEGYFHEAHGWVTVEAYELYIRDDVCRLRQPR